MYKSPKNYPKLRSPVGATPLHHGGMNEHSEKVVLYVEPSDNGSLHIFCGNSNRELAAEVASKLAIQCGRASVKKFVDGETSVVIHDSVRGNDIFILQSISPPVNDNLMELIFMISALRRASAKSITAVIPYYGYSRQSKMKQGYRTIGAADVALLLETVGVDRVISLDLHEGQIEGFFSPKVPVDNLEPYLAAVPYFARKRLNDVVFIAPSAHGVARTKKFYDVFVRETGISARMAMVVGKTDSNSDNIEMDLQNRKEETDYGPSERIVIGEIRPDSDVIIVDDIIDTGNRAFRASVAVYNHGCGNIYAFATHGLTFEHVGLYFRIIFRRLSNQAKRFSDLRNSCYKFGAN